MNDYFANLKDIFDKYNFHNQPQPQVDETGIRSEHRPPNVIAPIHIKPQVIISPRSTTTTVIDCANATGNSLPACFVFKAKRYNPDLMESASPGAQYEMSET